MSQLVVTCCSMLLGTIIVVQAYVNINLGNALGHPLRAACVSFCVGAFSLLALHIVLTWKASNKVTTEEKTPTAMVGTADAVEETSEADVASLEVRGTINWDFFTCWSRCWAARIPYYYYCGGLLGTFYVSNATISVPYIGYSVFYVCFVCGQLMCALAFDKYGLLESPVLDIHPGRYVGCLCAAAGSVLLLLVGERGDARPVLAALMVLGSFLSGVFLVTQSAVNTILRKRENFTVVRTALTSFSVGAAALLVISSFTVMAPSVFTAEPVNGSALQWWHFFGGIIGLVYVGSAVVFPHIIGYAAFVVSLIAGQLATSLLSDRFGLFGPEKASAYHPLGILGVCLAVLGAALVTLFR
jgi:bacterial/archaeal transporter family-2 protein